jgi:hypothetical protein
MDEGEYDGKAGVHVRAAGRDPAQVVDTRRAAVVTMKFRYGNSQARHDSGQAARALAGLSLSTDLRPPAWDRLLLLRHPNGLFVGDGAPPGTHQASSI